MEDNLFQLNFELKNKTYKHSEYIPFYVTDPKLRHIHKACVLDRVLHQAIFRILYPIFDKHFIYDSYSCRVGKGTHIAVTRLETFYKQLSKNNSRNVFALKCDIKKFFDSIDQNILTKLIQIKIKDENAMWLVERIIKSFEKDKDKALPLGNVTSQLFANIYLNELDQFIKHKLKEKYYIRYCDDFVILSEQADYLIELSKKINNFLVSKLVLCLHPNKVIIRKYAQGIDFLGYVVLPNHRVLRTKTKRRMFRKVDAKNLASYLGMLKHCSGSLLEEKVKKLVISINNARDII
ncbi:MAG: reverse transcriptase/maturase family protein [bacterium]|nr:reverse transcriptase/maturase family protein [bacterium]